MTKRISPAARALAIGVVAALVLAGTAMGEVSKDGLVAEYHFDGDAKDTSGNGNDGTIHGATFVADDNVNGKALSFNGNGDYVEIPYTALENLVSGTIIARIKLNSNNDETIIAKQHNNVGTYGVFSIGYYVDSVGWANAGTPGKLYFHGHNPVTEASSSSVMNTGQWYQVAVVFTDTYAKFYIDGSPSNTLNDDYSIPGDTTTATIGAWLGDGGGRYFNGLIDEVRIYNRALSANEIKASYEEIKSPSSQPTPSTTDAISRTGLIAEYHFDGDAKDSSENGNDGTIYGATFVDGIVGKALSFNGVNNYVTAPITDSFNSIKSQGTITTWINFKDDYLNSEAGTSCSYGSRALMLWRFGTYTIKSSSSIDCADRILSDWRFGESDSQKGNIISQKLESGRWYHVALSYDNNYVILYLNGQKVKSSGLSGELKDSDDKFWIGRNGQAGQPMYFQGLVDEVRIYNRALSAEEIKANYDSIIGKSPATTTIKSASAPTSSPATPAPTIAQTAIPTPAPTAAPEASNSYIYAGAGIVILLLAIIVLRRRSSFKVEEPLKREPTVRPEPQKPAPMTVPEAPGVYVKTAFGYKGAAIIYKLKIENNTSDPISDIKVYPYVPDVFLLKEREKSIALIEPKASQTVTFEIRPTGECGDCNVSGRVNYYNTASRKRQDIEIEQKSLSIVCPMLHGKEISETDWHDTVSNLVKTEESTREIDMPAESLFTMVSRIIKDMHMHMQKPEITQNHKLFNGVARFYGEGVKGLKYAAQVEVVGGAKKSKLILKVWAEKEDALTGFYHGMLDEIEKRVNVKEYIENSIVQYNVHIGDKIGTLVKDSVVQRSTIGASSRKCPDCGREVEANEKFCLECGAKLNI